MSIQILRTTGSGNEHRGRQLVGLVSSLALAAVVATAVVIGMSNRQTGSTGTGTAEFTSGQPIQSNVQADALGGVAERTQLQAQLAAPRVDVMGGMAERMLLQGQTQTAQPSNEFACGTSPYRTQC
jgi:hypothetical protein